MATEGWRGLETGDLGDQLEFGVLLAVLAQIFVELQCLQRNIGVNLNNEAGYEL